VLPRSVNGHGAYPPPFIFFHRMPSFLPPSEDMRGAALRRTRVNQQGLAPLIVIRVRARSFVILSGFVALGSAVPFDALSAGLAGRVLGQVGL